jgi:hypothetical protein
MTPAFTGEVNAAGVLRFPGGRAALDRWLMTLKGKAVEIVIKEKRSRRSQDQNAWHWAVAVPLIAEAMGHSRDEYEMVHYALVQECFGTVVDERTGLHVPKVRSSKLDTKQFSELMEWEVRFAAEKLGLYVPLPDDIAA